MTDVLAATAAVVLLLSLPPAAAGSGAVFMQKTVYTRAVVVVCSRVANARNEALRLELPTTHVCQNTDVTSHSVAHWSPIMRAATTL